MRAQPPTKGGTPAPLYDCAPAELGLLVRHDPDTLDSAPGALFRCNNLMAVHTITPPDMLRGDEPRAMLWDDEAGAVSGTHYDLPYIRQVFAAPKPVEVGVCGRVWRLRDPAHDPAKFLILLYISHWPVWSSPLRETLPAVFDGVQPPPGEPDEDLYGADGKRRE